MNGPEEYKLCLEIHFPEQKRTWSKHNEKVGKWMEVRYTNIGKHQSYFQ